MEERDTAAKVARMARDMRRAFGIRAETIAARMAAEAAPRDAKIADVWLRIGDAIGDETG